MFRAVVTQGGVVYTGQSLTGPKDSDYICIYECLLQNLRCVDSDPNLISLGSQEAGFGEGRR